LKSPANFSLCSIMTSIVVLLAVLFSSTQCLVQCATCHSNKSSASTASPCHEHSSDSNKTQPVKRVCDFSSFLAVSEAATPSDFQEALANIIFFGPSVMRESARLQTIGFVPLLAKPFVRQSNVSPLVLRV